MGARRAPTHRLAVAAVAVSVAMTACSSTKDLESEQPGDTQALTQSGAPEDAAPDPVPTGVDGSPLSEEEVEAAVKEGKLSPGALQPARQRQQGTSGGTSAGTAGGAPPADGSTGGGTGGSSDGGAAKSGPGFSGSEIKIGISVFKPGSFAEQIGVDAGFGDGQRQAQAVLDYVNAHGGIAGRKVKPVFYVVDFGRDPSSFQDGQFEAEACEKWANDERVAAAINNAMARPALLPCLAKKGVPAVHDGMVLDEKRIAPYRDYYYTGVGTAALTYDRIVTTTARVLAGNGFYKAASADKPTVVGILHFDDPALTEVVTNKLVPLLKSFGVKKVVTQAASYAPFANHSAFVSRFQAEGVTHVHFLGEADLYPTYFMPAAENQRFRPKYGISTEQRPAFLEKNASIPRPQLQSATAVGWSQLLDVNNPADPGPTGRNDKLCLDIQKRAGQDMSERGARFTATMYCSGLFFLKQNLDKAAGPTAAGLAGSVSRLGTGYDSPGTFNPTSYSATKHDGGAAYRLVGFRDGAFVYTSGVKRMP